MSDTVSQLPAGATLLPDEGITSLPAGATLLPDDQSSAPGLLARGWNAEKTVLHTDNQVARSMSEGIPVLGGLLNKADAGIDAFFAPMFNPLFPKDQQLQGSLGDRYHQALAVQNGMDQQFHQAHPVADTAAHVAGGVLGGVAGARFIAPTMAGLGISAAPGLGGVAVRAATGAAGGAGIGAADAETRGEDVGRSAVLGALLGGFGSVAGDIVNPIFRYFGQKPSEFASDVISRGLGSKRDAVAKALISDPNRIVADDNASLIQALRQTRDTSGPWQDQIEQALTNRANSTLERTKTAIQDATGIQQSLPRYLRDMDAARAAQAAPYYDAAYKADVPITPELQEVLARPGVEKAYNAAHRLASDAGEAFDMGKPNVLALDYTKRALDDAISSNLRAGNNNEARILIGNRNAILDHLDTHVPEYATGRNIYAGHSALMNASEEGKTFLSRSMSPDEVQFRLEEMSDGEREAAKVGFRQDLMNKVGSINADAPQGAANAGLRTPNMREAAHIVLGGDEADKLLSSVARERMYAMTNNRATSGSPTSFNIGMDGPPSGAGILNALLNRNPIGLTVKALETAFPRLTAANKDARYQALADALLSHSLPSGGPTPTVSPAIAAALIGADQQGSR
ncbi:hypothetical protein AD945_08345 [Gluconobacter albidus]|uniref:Uncharacterized protein n=1 Tax=Gluconobacter albidus TaxID=318683 RepID=A0A149TJ46_9PROT|nr:hypothetical protein [Gluconobacter albidus]KXV48206.1 hypothetical protein AD945_08345 [Gluconobacter albidus]